MPWTQCPSARRLPSGCAHCLGACNTGSVVACESVKTGPGKACRTLRRKEPTGSDAVDIRLVSRHVVLNQILSY